MTTPDIKGKWKPGQSGNPKGRKPGSGAIAPLRAAIAEHIPAIVNGLAQAALKGDVGAARLLLERTLPPLRAVDLPISLELPRGTLTEQAGAVLAAMAEGRLTSNQGAALIAAVAQLARVVELDEISRRLSALESNANNWKTL